jgi:DNA-binding LacI/PurR family transcriptional regulator
MSRVTMTVIAAKAGVSKNTVSLALRHDAQIPAKTRKRIENIAKRLGYVSNPVVAHLMTELRRVSLRGYQRTVALLNAHTQRDSFTNHPTIPVYVEGCKRRAAALGYRLDEFWLNDPKLDGAQLNRILRTRGIRGCIIIGLMKTNKLPTRFAPVWAESTCVVTGVRTQHPTLPFCCVDHHALVQEACEQVIIRGYQRPALVVDEKIDRLVDGRFSAGMWTSQQTLARSNRIGAFLNVEAARADLNVFKIWLQKHKPDVLLTLYPIVHQWLTTLGYSVPRDIGLVQLERRRNQAEWAGMDQHNDLVGEAAVDMLISQIHADAPGIPAHPKATLVSGTWLAGTTLNPSKERTPLLNTPR